MACSPWFVPFCTNLSISNVDPQVRAAAVSACAPSQQSRSGGTQPSRDLQVGKPPGRATYTWEMLVWPTSGNEIVAGTEELRRKLLAVPSWVPSQWEAASASP